MRVDITTYKEDGSELITRRYDFEEHQDGADAIQDILDDSREYEKDRPSTADIIKDIADRRAEMDDDSDLEDNDNN